MPEVCSLIWLALVGAFRSRVSLEAENTILRHQLNVLRRQSPKRPTFGMLDRLIFAGLYRLAPKVLGALAIVKPETMIKWHRAGFRSYWRWKSRRRGGRPTVAPEIRKLIREMSIANPLWGAPRIHGELLKLGIDIGQTSVAKYMAKRRDPPSQGWRTFLRNHADGIAAMDLFVVPTISFRLLYGLLIVGHGRRQILWFGVTAHPTAEWIANQITEACGWEQAPRYLIRDRDGAYGEVFIRRLRSMGIRDRPTSPRSPWQNGYAERLIGSIRRESAARRNSLESSSSEGATRTASGATATTSYGSSLGLEDSVECMALRTQSSVSRPRRPADYAARPDVLPQPSFRFDQSKAVRWRVLGRFWQPPFGTWLIPGPCGSD